jgi:hypothetical protein
MSPSCRSTLNTNSDRDQPGRPVLCKIKFIRFASPTGNSVLIGITYVVARDGDFLVAPAPIAIDGMA